MSTAEASETWFQVRGTDLLLCLNNLMLHMPEAAASKVHVLQRSLGSSFLRLQCEGCGAQSKTRELVDSLTAA
jgi:hypothetical protein